MSIRRPAVAGTFYPGDAKSLRGELTALLPESPKRRALAVVVPHAGYVYSGPVAGATYACVEVTRDVVVLAFNHRGRGAAVAIWPEGAWKTPLGEAPVANELAENLKHAYPEAVFDEEGHLGEHSLEVQIPFLQHLRSDVRILPVALSVGIDEASTRRLREFGEALARTLTDELVVCSTDLNHYDEQAVTLEKDAKVIAAIERLDIDALRRAILEGDVSMCGFAPTIATIAYARARGATAAETVLHRTSGDESGDYDRVVGYVGMIIPCGN